MLREHGTLAISEAAKALSVSVSWMRLGERCGALPQARRTPNGWRYYAKEDIKHLQRLGVGKHKRRLEGRDE